MISHVRSLSLAALAARPANARAETHRVAVVVGHNAGGLVLTEIGARSAAIELPTGFDRALVVALQRDQIIAEVRSDAARRIAVVPGSYKVRLWRKGTVVAGRLEVADGALTAVRWDDLRPIDTARTAAKGDVVTGKDQVLAPAAQRVYDENMLSFGDEQTIQISENGTLITPTYRTYLGKYRREIDIADFLHRAGRDDLAKTYTQRRTIKNTIGAVGLTLVVGGVIYLFTHSCNSPGDNTPIDTGCLATGTGVTLGGALTMFVSSAIPNRPAPPDEMRRFADEYNTRLRGRVLEERPASRSGSTTFAPYVVPGGAGGVLSVTF